MPWESCQLVSPRLEARVTGGLYLLNILVGILALILINRKMQTQGDQVNFIAGVIYTGVTVLLWHIFWPVNKWVSTVAAIFSLMGCWLPQAVYTAAHLNNFVCFGVYCLSIAYLIARSHYFPVALGLLRYLLVDHHLAPLGPCAFAILDSRGGDWRGNVYGVFAVDGSGRAEMARAVEIGLGVHLVICLRARSPYTQGAPILNRRPFRACV